MAIREHTTLDASEPLRRGNHAHVLSTPQAMAVRFADHPEAVAESRRLAETLTFDLGSDLGYRYPGAEDATAGRALAEVCAARFDERYPRGSPHHEEAKARLEEELRVIDELGLAGFFLLHRDLLELAREVAVEVRGRGGADGATNPRSLLPPGRGRGSSVSSIVCHLTGLSHVDPIANKLLLGRFLNEELTALPDIDLDFPRDIREVLIPRVHERYGRERSALVAAFPTYRARGAIREIGKALGLPPGEIERVARGSEGWSSRDVDRDIDTALGEGRRTGRWAWLVRLADEAYGLPRHLSQHSGGMIVATRPLVDCVPLVPAAMEGRQLAQWDKDSCADAGFLKIDLLGLGMLSAVERCVDHIARRRGELIDLSRIPYDDPATYECIQNAETTGVFQIESRAQMGSLRRTRPETLDDITIQVAIVRPGPIVGGAVNPYIERRQRLRADPSFEVPFLHPSLEPPLRDTLGTIIFQDQVLEVAQAFAGFSVGEAEGLRRAMSRKRSAEALEAYHQRFVDGALAKHSDVSRERAEEVFSMVAGFSGFGFPKAHGAAFGLLAYQSTWLRVHYGPEFLCALLDEQPMGFYPPDALVHEAQRRGIEVLAPEVNASEVGCTVRNSSHPPAPDQPRSRSASATCSACAARRSRRSSRRVTRAVRLRRSRTSPRAREPGGRRSRSSPGRAPATRWRAATAASRCGSSGSDRRPACAPAGARASSSRWRSTCRRRRSSRRCRPGTRWSPTTRRPGFTAATHPIELLRPRLRAAGAVDIGALDRLQHGAPVRIGGLVIARQRPGTAKGITFLLLEDEHGTVNVIVSPQIYERDRLTVRTEPLVVVEGRLERHASAGGAINVVARGLTRLEVGDRVAAQVKDFSMLDALELARQAALRELEEGQALAATGTDDFRAVAPPVMNFGAGRRR